MQLFVTGATGFIGSHFVAQALERGHNVVALRRLPKSSPRILLTQQPVWLEKSLRSVAPSDLAGVDVVVHLAAGGVTPQPATWASCYETNVTDSLSMVRTALRAGVRKFVVTGTCAEYGTAALRFDPIPPDSPLEPTDPYSSSKASAAIGFCAMCRSEKFLLSYQRLFSVYGEGQHHQNFWPALKRAALAGDDFPMTVGEQVRDFISVSEVAGRLLWNCERSDFQSGQPVVENLGSGRPQTLRDFAEHWWETWKAEGRLMIGAVEYRPNEVMRYVPKVA